jgi:hypothetical protein
MFGTTSKFDAVRIEPGMFTTALATKRLLPTVALAWLMLTVIDFEQSIAQEDRRNLQRFELRIENGRVIDSQKVIKVRHHDIVEINWSADRRTLLHLHGYDIETTVEPSKPQLMSFVARATGRFPIETHGRRHNVLLYLEVHPR